MKTMIARTALAMGALAAMLAVQSASAAESQKQSAAGAEQKSQAKPEKKAPGTAQKAGDSVKSGWNKLTRSVKQGRTKPVCTPEQKSLKQCQ